MGLKKREFHRKYSMKNRHPWTPERKREMKNRLYHWTKKLVFLGYGGKCACCGEAEFDFLTIDHVFNNGAEERKNGLDNGYSLFRRIINNGFPSEYRLLCWNCNCSRYHFGVCPHEKSRQAIAELDSELSLIKKEGGEIHGNTKC